MDENERPLLADLHDDLKSLAAEVREMAASRWELARLELVAQGKMLTRLVCIGFAAALMTLVALPLLAWCLADALDGWLGVARSGWLLGMAVGLLGFALLSGIFAVRRFRRRATGLQETLEELREDIVWLREWFGGGPRDDGSRE
jgi:uncharacterized membrane protein YqjE